MKKFVILGLIIITACAQNSRKLTIGKSPPNAKSAKPLDEKREKEFQEVIKSNSECLAVDKFFAFLKNNKQYLVNIYIADRALLGAKDVTLKIDTDTRIHQLLSELPPSLIDTIPATELEEKAAPPVKDLASAVQDGCKSLTINKIAYQADGKTPGRLKVKDDKNAYTFTLVDHQLRISAITEPQPKLGDCGPDPAVKRLKQDIVIDLLDAAATPVVLARPFAEVLNKALTPPPQQLELQLKAPPADSKQPTVQLASEVLGYISKARTTPELFKIPDCPKP